MPYVMVPVPEEHVEEAMEAVLRITRNARLTPWTQEAMNSFFAQLDESAKALLSLVARATTAGKQISQAGASDRLEITQREILGIVRDINLQAQNEDHSALLLPQEATETLPNGRTRPVAVITSNPEVAGYVQVAERSELGTRTSGSADGPGGLSG